MLRTLAATHPDAHCELDFRTPLELAVATILSAQSTDKLVNSVTPALFERYPTALDYAKADRTELETMIHSTGFFRNKATSLIGLILVVAGTGINVLLAVLFNLISDLVGGVRFTVIEEESARPVPADADLRG